MPKKIFTVCPDWPKSARRVVTHCDRCMERDGKSTLAVLVWHCANGTYVGFCAEHWDRKTNEQLKLLERILDTYHDILKFEIKFMEDQIENTRETAKS